MPYPLLGVLSLILLAVSPAPAQQDTTVMLDGGDRVRLWSQQAGMSGEEFDFQRWQDASLVLTEPRAGRVTRLPRRQIDRMQVRRKSGGTNLWEGVLIGGGAGVLAYVVDVNSTRTDQWLPNYLIHASRTVLPGLVVGGLVGSAIPEYEWISVEFMRGHEQSCARDWPPPGFSFRVQIPVPVSM